MREASLVESWPVRKWHIPQRFGSLTHGQRHQDPGRTNREREAERSRSTCRRKLGLVESIAREEDSAHIRRLAEMDTGPGPDMRQEHSSRQVLLCTAGLHKLDPQKRLQARDSQCPWQIRTRLRTPVVPAGCSSIQCSQTAHEVALGSLQRRPKTWTRRVSLVPTAPSRP